MTSINPTYLEELLSNHRYDGQVLRAAVLENGPDYIGPLIEALPNERGTLLAIAIRLLAELGDPRAVVPLIDVLLKEDWSYPPPTAFRDRLLHWASPYLRRLVRETAEHRRILARTAAARALAQLGDPRAIGALLAIRNDPDERVRAIVETALDRLGALDLSNGAA